MDVLSSKEQDVPKYNNTFFLATIIILQYGQLITAIAQGSICSGWEQEHWYICANNSWNIKDFKSHNSFI